MRFEYMQSKNVGMTRLSSPAGYASGNSDWWKYGFDAFVAIANPGVDNSRWPRKDKNDVVCKICNRQKNA